MDSLSQAWPVPTDKYHDNNVALQINRDKNVAPTSKLCRAVTLRIACRVHGQLLRINIVVKCPSTQKGRSGPCS